MSADFNETRVPTTDWQAYRGVLSRRIFAFLIDYAIIALLWIPAAVVVFFLGILMGAPALLWSGFRAFWGVRALPWIGPVVGAASAALLVAAGDTIWFSPAYRVVFFAASVCAGLFFVDWVRVPARRDRVALPFVIMSLAFFAAGAANAIAGFVFPATTGDDLALVRLVTSIGMLAYTACALVAAHSTAARQSGFRDDSDEICTVHSLGSLVGHMAASSRTRNADCIFVGTGI